MLIVYLLALFIGLPLVELALLLKLGEVLGWRPTLALVIVTGLAGAFLARHQGMRVILNIRRDLEKGRMPAPYLFDGLMILVAAALLVTPGLITDASGFLLLLPPFRRWVRGVVRRKFAEKLERNTIDVTYWEW
jgi:UPF0716 protein FxsA